MWSGIMAPVVSSAPSPRYLCLVLPYLPTDRFLRQKLGRAWRSAGRPEAPEILPVGMDASPPLPGGERAFLISEPKASLGGKGEGPRAPPDRVGERGQRQPLYDGGEPLSSYARPFSAGPSFAISPARGKRELAGPDTHPPDDDLTARPPNLDSPLPVVAKSHSALRPGGLDAAAA